MLAAGAVSKRIGSRWILHRVSLSVPDGQVLGLFGPNGAGKTTLLRILALLARPTEGQVVLRPAGHGERLLEGPALRAHLGFLGHESYLDPRLTARENLSFYARLYDVPQSDRRVDELLDQVGLALFAHEPVRTFSRGMVQRLAMARTFLHRPSLLFLDEPLSGLDAQGAVVFEALLGEARAARASAVLVSHDVAAGWRLADRVAVLAGGELVLEGPASEIGPDRVQAEYRARAQSAERSRAAWSASRGRSA